MVTSKLSAKDKAADLRLKREYYPLGGLAEYNKVLKFQGGNCAICKKPVPLGKPRLAVDHCHTTGLLRGLLCWKCNRAIAVFRDNAEMLTAAAAYLKVPPISAVFGTPRFTAPGRVGTKKRAKALKLLLQTVGTQSKAGEQ